MLELKNLSFSVEENGRQKPILRGLNLKIDNSRFVVITGPNGSGKSTLAKLIMGIEKPTEGQIFFDGRELTALSPEEYRALRGCEMSMVFQEPMTSFNPVVARNTRMYTPLMRIIGRRAGRVIFQKETQPLAPSIMEAS